MCLNRYEAAQQALACDGLLAASRIRQAFGVSAKDIGGYKKYVKVQYSKNSKLSPRFLIVDSKRRRSDADIRHLLGLSAMRFQLSVPPEAWTLSSKRVKAAIPDALYEAEQEWAIEYDTGFYSKKVLSAKLEAFYRQFDKQLWGSYSQRRLDNIKALADDLYIPIQTHKIEYY